MGTNQDAYGQLDWQGEVGAQRYQEFTFAMMFVQAQQRHQQQHQHQDRQD